MKKTDENGTIRDDSNKVLVEYPSNSNKGKINEVGVEEDKKKKIIKGSVITKRSIGKEVSNSFADAFGYIVNDVLVPALKNTVSDMVRNGVDILLFGNTRDNRRRDNNTYISYSNYSRDDRRDDRRQVYSMRNRQEEDIILETRGEAEEVVDNLMDYIDKYGVATVADLYDLIGKKTEYTDNDYGWRDLSTVRVRQVREGYLLELPRSICVK